MSALITRITFENKMISQDRNNLMDQHWRFDIRKNYSNSQKDFGIAAIKNIFRLMLKNSLVWAVLLDRSDVLRDGLKYGFVDIRENPKWNRGFFQRTDDYG